MVSAYPCPSLNTYVCAGVLCLFAFSANTALASAPPIVMKVDPDSIDQDQPANNGAFGFLDGIQRSQTMLGGMWGLRPWLGQYGMSFNLQETSEELGNVSGGSRQGFDYDGLTQMAVQMDTQRAFGWYGGTFNASALQIHGSNLSADNLGHAANRERHRRPTRATRLWELWYQQKFLDEDRLDVKIGQQSLDQEFMVSQNANYFINTMFGWPMLPSADLPGGGPAYPLSALGVRARAKPNDSITILAGVFNGSPAQQHPDSQQANSRHRFPARRRRAGDRGNAICLSGASARWSAPMHRANCPAPINSASGTTPKISPIRNMAPIGIVTRQSRQQRQSAMHHGDYGIYAVADQMLWHSENLEDRTLNFFTRVMGTPETDRNLIDFSMNAGFTLHEPYPRARQTILSASAWAMRDVSSRAAGVRPGHRFLQSRHLYAGPQQRNFCRSDLSISGDAVVAGAAGLFNMCSIPAPASWIRTTARGSRTKRSSACAPISRFNAEEQPPCHASQTLASLSAVLCLVPPLPAQADDAKGFLENIHKHTTLTTTVDCEWRSQSLCNRRRAGVCRHNSERRCAGR